MLFQIQNCRLWLRTKMGQRGAALVEYAILLAFVAVVGAAFISGDSTNGTIASKAESIIKKITKLMSDADSASNTTGG